MPSICVITIANGIARNISESNWIAVSSSLEQGAWDARFDDRDCSVFLEMHRTVRVSTTSNAALVAQNVAMTIAPAPVVRMLCSIAADANESIHRLVTAINGFVPVLLTWRNPLGLGAGPVLQKLSINKINSHLFYADSIPHFNSFATVYFYAF